MSFDLGRLLSDFSFVTFIDRRWRLLNFSRKVLSSALRFNMMSSSRIRFSY